MSFFEINMYGLLVVSMIGISWIVFKNFNNPIIFFYYVLDVTCLPTGPRRILGH